MTEETPNLPLQLKHSARKEKKKKEKLLHNVHKLKETNV